MKKNRKIIGIMFIVFTSLLAQAKIRVVTNRSDFERTISRDNMVVALFYESEKGNKDLRNQNRDLISMYEDVSGYRPYDTTGITFLRINIAHKDTADLATLYNIATVPMFIFFYNGKRLVDDQGKTLTLNGFISRVDLQSFIDQYYGSQIKKAQAKKEKRKKQMVAEENEAWKQYFYPRDMVVRGYGPGERQENME